MRYLLLCFAMFSGLSFGAANDMYINQRNSADTGTFSRTIVPPVGENGIFVYEESSKFPKFFTVGDGLEFDGTQLKASVPAGPQGPKGDTGEQGPKGDFADFMVVPNPPRAFDSNYRISSTRAALVNYTVKTTVTTTLLIASASATAYLEYSMDSGASWITVSDSGSSIDGVSVAIGQVIRGRHVLGGFIPANALVRIRTETTGSGTGTIEYVTGQEVYL